MVSSDDDADDSSRSDDDDDGQFDLSIIKGGKKKNAFAGLNINDDSSSESSNDDDIDESVEEEKQKVDKDEDVVDDTEKLVLLPAESLVTTTTSTNDDDAIAAAAAPHDDDNNENDEQIIIDEFRHLIGRVTRHGSVIHNDVVATILQGLIGSIDDDKNNNKSSTSRQRPTAIQRECWTTMLSKSTHDRDVIAISKTGSGKTLAFLVPLLCGLSSHYDHDHHQSDHYDAANDDDDLADRQHQQQPPFETDEPEKHDRRQGDAIHKTNNSSGDTADAAPSTATAAVPPAKTASPPSATTCPSSAAFCYNIYPRAIVLAPTRVLAQQIFQVTSWLVQNTPSLSRIKVSMVLGGASFHQQVRDLLATSPDMIIATPGRFNSLCGRTMVVAEGDDEQEKEVAAAAVVEPIMDTTTTTVIRLDRVDEVVIDEADMILALGFHDDLSWFATMLNSTSAHQFRLVLTSATWEEESTTTAAGATATSVSLFQTISSKDATEPVRLVADGAGQVVTKNVTQTIHVIAHKGAPRFKALVALLSTALQEQQNNVNARMIVFCLHKAEARQMGKDLHDKGIANIVLEGDMSQSARAAAIAAFRTTTTNGVSQHGGGQRVLVATDVAARGLDVQTVSHVFNYSVGLSVEGYIHRCGRTGRAGRFGIAHTFVVKGLDEKFTPELCTVLRQAHQIVPDDLRIMAAKEMKRRQQRQKNATATTPTTRGGVDSNRNTNPNNDNSSDDDVEEMRRANRAKQLRKHQEQNVRGGGGDTKKKGPANRRGR